MSLGVGKLVLITLWVRSREGDGLEAGRVWNEECSNNVREGKGRKTKYWQ